MVTKNDFSIPDWTALRDTPYIVGFATLLAGSSGLATIKELFALSQGIVANQASDVPVIRELTSKDEMESAQMSLKQSFGAAQGKTSSEAMQRRALELAQSSTALLAAKGSKEEVNAYSRMLYGVAEKVANAAREGGFLGFGGTQVSEGERSFLEQLRSALQLELIKRA